MGIKFNQGFSKMLIQMRRKIHSYPEIGYNEFKTSQFVLEHLRNWGIKARKVGNTGVVALLKAGNSKRCIGLRADLDALPICTQLKKPYASKTDGVMHACGHDANIAIVMGAAFLLKKELPKLRSNVKFIFQPAEETANGARMMIKNNVLKDPKVDVMFGVHVNPELKVGSVGIKKGRLMAAVDRFKIEFYGGGGHGAYPHLGKDTLLAASECITLINHIVSRQIDPLEPVVISVCKIAGGDSFNVLADRVEIEGTVRTFDYSLQKVISEKIRRIIKSIGNIYRLKTNFEYDFLGRVLVNNESVAGRVMNIANKMKDDIKVKVLSKPSMGGEDFAEYLESVKGCFLYMGSGSHKSTRYPWHHPKFDIDEKTLHIGANFLKNLILQY
ncbi:MAG: M20 family metallopeptidase [bacterium]